MTTLTRVRPVLLTASAVFLGACGDTPVEPLPDYDPTRTLQQLNAVVDPLNASENAFLGLSLATATVADYGYGTSAAALAAGAAALEPALRAWGRPQARLVPGPERFRAAADAILARRGTPAGESRTQARVTMPAGIRGYTLVWDPIAGYLVSDRPGAPANGVRLVLYAMSSSSGYPSQPLTEIGYIDLTDEDRTLSERVGVRVVEAGVSFSVTLADYTVDMSVTGTTSEGSLTLDATGEIGEPASQVAFDLIQDYSWSQAGNTDALVLDYALQTPGAGTPVLLTVDARSAFNAAAWATLRFVGSFDPGTTSEVQLDVSIDETDALDGGVWTEGREVVRVGGFDGDPRFLRGDGSALTQPEVTALEQIWIGLSDLVTLGEWVMIPADILYLDG